MIAHTLFPSPPLGTISVEYSAAPAQSGSAPGSALQLLGLPSTASLTSTV